MPGAPSLGINLAYDPFRPSLPRQAPPREPEIMPRRTDGFSQDGLSYAVIDDLGKITAQALAEYEARVNNPRIDIWGKTLREDTPAYLDQTLLQPIRDLSGADSGKPTQRRTWEIGNTLVEQDPNTGAVRTIFEGPAKAQPEQKFPGPTELDMTLKPSNVKSFTARDWANLGPGLAPQIRTNAPVSDYIQWGQQSNSAPSLKLSAPQTPQTVTTNRQPLKILSIKERTK